MTNYEDFTTICQYLIDNRPATNIIGNVRYSYRHDIEVFVVYSMKDYEGPLSFNTPKQLYDHLVEKGLIK